MFKNFDFQFFVVVLGVIVAIITFVWSITIYIRNKHDRIRITCSLDRGFKYKDNINAKDVNSINHVISVKIKNAGYHGCFVDPSINVWISRKIKGNEIYTIFEEGENIIDLKELKPGETLEKRYKLAKLWNDLLYELKEKDKIRFIVDDSLGNRYKSKRIKIGKLKKFKKLTLEELY